jgi:hypothetical protein
VVDVALAPGGVTNNEKQEKKDMSIKKVEFIVCDALWHQPAEVTADYSRGYPAGWSTWTEGRSVLHLCPECTSAIRTLLFPGEKVHLTAAALKRLDDMVAKYKPATKAPEPTKPAPFEMYAVVKLKHGNDKLTGRVIEQQPLPDAQGVLASWAFKVDWLDDSGAEWYYEDTLTNAPGRFPVGTKVNLRSNPRYISGEVIEVSTSDKFKIRWQTGAEGWFEGKDMVLVPWKPKKGDRVRVVGGKEWLAKYPQLAAEVATATGTSLNGNEHGVEWRDGSISYHDVQCLQLVHEKPQRIQARYFKDGDRVQHKNDPTDRVGTVKAYSEVNDDYKVEWDNSVISYHPAKSALVKS